MAIYEGKTVADAIEAGLKDLGLTEETAEIKVLDEGVKGGFLGLGGKKAQVEVIKRESDGKRAAAFLEGLFDLLKVNAATEVKEEDDKITINLIATAGAALIGHRGETLDALQTLAGAVANIGNEEYKRVVVDCENYREKREETLKSLANKLADKALRTGRKVTLEPMNPFERRVIHSALTGNEHVKTESQGVEPNRYIVIVPDNMRPYSRGERSDRRDRNDRFERRGGRGGRGERRDGRGGFKSEMLKIDKKTTGFGTFLGNSLKND